MSCCPPSRRTTRRPRSRGARSGDARCRHRTHPRLQGVAVRRTPATGGRRATLIPRSSPTRSSTWSGPGPIGARSDATTNVVLRFVPAEGRRGRRSTRAIRRETARVARELAASTLAAEPDDVATPTPGRLPPASADPAGDRGDRAGGLGGAARRHVLRGGTDDRRSIRAVFDPRTRCWTVQLTNGAYDWPGVRNVTAVYQDNALVRALFAGARRPAPVRRADPHARLPRHRGGEAARGRGVRRRSPPRSAPTARSAPRSRAGNSHTDTMLTVRACEAARDRARSRSCARRTAASPTTSPRPTASSHRERGGARRTRGRPSGCSAASARRRRRREPVPDLGVPRRRASQTGDARTGRRCRRDDRPLPQPVLRRARRRGGGRPRSRRGSTDRRDRAAASPPPALALDVTLACGDDHFAEHEAEALAALLRWLDGAPPRRPDLRSVVRLGPLRLRVRRARARGWPPRRSRSSRR